MFYCFIKEELEQIPKDDPLWLQVKYAERLQQLCLCSLKEKSILDVSGKKLEISGKRIFLRSSYPHMHCGMKIVKCAGGFLSETESDIRKIENWIELDLNQRPIISCTYKDLHAERMPEKIGFFLRGKDKIFVKSREKGFTAAISAERILKKDNEVLDFLKSRCKEDDGIFMSEYLTMKTDSLGKRESRHIVLDNIIINSSRILHSVCHSVPKSERDAAVEFVKRIAEKKDFPRNYVIDVAEFEKEKVMVDIVELNPLTPAMCYVNNSIFECIVPEIEGIIRHTGMGAEFCYDSLEHGERYIKYRRSGEYYGYTNESHYCFT